MKISTEAPEGHVTLSLEQRQGGVVLVARNYDSGDDRELLLFTAAGKPTNGDPLGQHNEKLTIRTLNVGDQRAQPWIDVNEHNHVEIGMKA
jgi:hypothetical protein